MPELGLSATPLDGTIDFTCPRCQREVHELLYGPCTPCRAELRATQGNVARAVDVGVYEPKMNVTPNQVATKD